jgi:hypothetical protein
MSLFDGVIATAFQNDADGRSIFCPWGLRGRCYVLTPAQDAEVRRFLRAYYGGFFLVLIPGAYFLGWWVLLLPVVAVGGLYLKFWLVTRMLRPFIGAIPTVSADQLLRQHARATGRPVLWILFVAALGLAGWGAWLVIAGERTVAAYFVVLCLVAIAVGVGLQIRRAG